MHFIMLHGLLERENALWENNPIVTPFLKSTDNLHAIEYTVPQKAIEWNTGVYNYSHQQSGQGEVRTFGTNMLYFLRLS